MDIVAYFLLFIACMLGVLLGIGFTLYLIDEYITRKR